MDGWSVDGAGGAQRAAARAVSRAVDFVGDALPGGRPLTAAERHRLRTAAAAASALPAFAPSSLMRATSAHRTNTPRELEHALATRRDILEGDLAVDRRGRLVMAHDASQIDGMLFPEWLDIAARSGRGVKIDVKDTRAIVPMLRMLRRAGVADSRLILNVPIGREGAVSARVGHLLLIRRLFPDSTVNLSNQRYPYDPGEIRQLRAAARYVGGRVMFPLRTDRITKPVVNQLQPYGLIAAWNQQLLSNPESALTERRRLRALGVDGTIDLGTRGRAGTDSRAPRVWAAAQVHTGGLARRAASWLA